MLLPKVKLKSVVNFPATAEGRTGIEVTKQNGHFFLGLAYSDFSPVISIPDPSHQNTLLWNNISGQYVLAPTSLFAGVGEAPNDGQQYARKNVAWTALPKITVSATAPVGPAINDVWIDTT